MPYLLDTNHLSPLVTPKHPLHHQVLQALQNGNDFGISLPCVTETLYGIGILPRAEKNLTEWIQLIPNFRIYMPDMSDAEKAAKLQISLRKNGWQLETVDALIAITAVRYQLTLLTTDKDFSAVPNLITENWLA